MKYHKGVASVILDLLHDGQVRKTSEIKQGVTASRSAFNQALQKLLTQGEIEKVAYGRYRKAVANPDVDTEPVDKPPARKDDNGLDTEPVGSKDGNPPAVDTEPPVEYCNRAEQVGKVTRKDGNPERAVDNPRKEPPAVDTERAVGKVTRKDDKPPEPVDNDPYRFVFIPAIKIY